MLSFWHTRFEPWVQVLRFEYVELAFQNGLLVCLGSSSGFPPSWTCPEPLPGEAGGISFQPAPLGVEKRLTSLTSELPISNLNPSRPGRKSQFSHSCLWSYSFLQHIYHTTARHIKVQTTSGMFLFCSMSSSAPTSSKKSHNIRSTFTNCLLHQISN